MAQKSFTLNRFGKSPLYLALFALIGFQVVCIGVVTTEKTAPAGKVIAQETRKCALGVVHERTLDLK